MGYQPMTSRLKPRRSAHFMYMGIDAALARGAIRASIGNSTAEAEIDRFLETWNTVAGSLLKERSGVAA